MLILLLMVAAIFFANNPDAFRYGTQSKPIEPFWWEIVLGAVWISAAVVWGIVMNNK